MLYGRDNKCIYNFSRKTLSEETMLVDLVLDGKSVFKQILKKQCVRGLNELIWLRSRLWAFGQHGISFQIP